ncbi:hypothetical protein BKA70DRAFT_1423727 [Coprinopsis sp. MPI-PUGE-AT-0042]|nr:hypothetical protein BKA70DRAFT_1423727 [Coprinopsis sp. MPI-PUGE-AT-0042]
MFPDHSNPSRSQERAPSSTNTTNSRVYSEVWGNISDLRSLSLHPPSPSARDADRYEVYGNQGTRSDARRGACRRFVSSAMSCLRVRPGRVSNPPSRDHNGDRVPHTAQDRSPSFSAMRDHHMISRRHTDGPLSTAGVVGEAYGNTSVSPLADGASYEQIYRDDPSLLPVRGASPRIPTNIDGAPQVIIGRVVGNFSSGPIGVNAKMKQVYEPPSRRATPANSPGSSASVVSSYTDSRNGEQSSRQGYSMIVPHHLQHSQSAPPGTLPFSGGGNVLGQSNGTRYTQGRRR